MLLYEYGIMQVSFLPQQLVEHEITANCKYSKRAFSFS